MDFIEKMQSEANDFSNKFNLNHMQEDAFRHAYTSAYLTHVATNGISASLGYSFELFGKFMRDNNPNDNRMDIYNNFKGRETYYELKEEINDRLTLANRITIHRINNEKLTDKNGDLITNILEKETIISIEEIEKADQEIKTMLAIAIKNKINNGELIIDPENDTREINQVNSEEGIITIFLREIWDYIIGANDLHPSLDQAERTSSPIVIDMNGDGIHATKLAGGLDKAVHFDLDGNGFAEKTAWIDASDALLVLDKNANGRIDNGHELFGNHSLNAEGKKAFADGYAALAAYDENQDGRIDAQDAVYAQLAVWQDKNGNGISEEGEMLGLAEAGIAAIDLNAKAVNERDAAGNRISHRGSVEMADGSQRLAEDLWFQINPAQTRYVGEALSPEAQAELLGLPNVRAFGNVLDLHLAMSRDAELKTMVADYLNAAPEAQGALLDALIYRWTGSAAVAADSRGGAIDARQLAALEALTGKDFRQHGSSPNPGPNASQILKAEYARFAQYTHAWLMLHSQAQQATALHLWQALGQDGLSDNGDLDWQSFAQQLQSQYQAGHLVQAQESYRIMEGLFTYSSAHAHSLKHYFAAHGEQYADLIEAGIVHQDYRGDEADNSFSGTANSEFIYGYEGNDRLNGNGGNDYLVGDKGNDYLAGGAGNDTYYFAPGHGQDVVYDYDYNVGNRDTIIFSDIRYQDIRIGWSGTDMILASGDSDQVRLQSFFSGKAYQIEHFQFADQSMSAEELLAQTVTLYGTANNDNFGYWQGALTFHAGEGHDNISGNAQDDTLYGEAGNDSLYGNGGNDRLFGGEGNDNLNGGDGNDVLFGGEGDDTLYGGAGEDTLEGGAGNDRLQGDFGNDTYSFAQGHGQDVIYDYDYTAGNRDTIIFSDIRFQDIRIGWSGSDMILYSGADDQVKLQSFFSGKHYQIELFQFADQSMSAEELLAQTVTLYGTANNDNFGYWQGALTFHAGEGHDNISGNAQDDTLYGEAGNDSLYGNGGNDRLFGGEGNDNLNGGDGNDYLYGGEGEDYLYAGMGNDLLNGGKGADRLYGGGGADVFVFDTLDAPDRIEDFDAREDKIALDDAFFSALGMQVQASAFAFADEAQTPDQHLLFNAKTGVLLYDADGSGAAAAQHVATVRGAALDSLSHERFEIV